MAEVSYGRGTNAGRMSCLRNIEPKRMQVLGISRCIQPGQPIRSVR